MVFLEALEGIDEVVSGHVLAFFGDFGVDIVFEPVSGDAELFSPVVEIGNALGGEEAVLLDE